MMNQEKIGNFIADLRKKKKLTQEQLAEKLGVSNRSVSRWENGNTMPDLSMLLILGEELGVSVSEILNGEYAQDKTENIKNVEKIIVMSQEEKRRKAQKINTYFCLGLLCIVIVILQGQFGVLNFMKDERAKDFLMGLMTSLGIAFEIAGFYYNSKERKYTERELAVLSNGSDRIQMRSSGEMLQFAKKNQKVGLKQYEKAFRKIEGELNPEEKVCFSMVADTFVVNEEWSDGWRPWHVGIAVTDQRILVCGETIRGRFMTAYDVAAFKNSDVCSVELIKCKIVIRTVSDVLHIGGENLEVVIEQLKKALK